MIRTFIIVLSLLAMTAVALAKEELLLTEVRKVRLLKIKDGRATVQGIGNSAAEVEVGDSVGRERGKVIEMGKSYILVELENLRIKIPIGIRAEK